LTGPCKIVNFILCVNQIKTSLKVHDLSDKKRSIILFYAETDKLSLFHDMSFWYALLKYLMACQKCNSKMINVKIWSSCSLGLK